MIVDRKPEQTVQIAIAGKYGRQQSDMLSAGSEASQIRENRVDGDWGPGNCSVKAPALFSVAGAALPQSDQG